VFVIAGIGVRQLSRTAALIAFLMYALAWLATGDWSILRPILLAILLGGVRAAAFAHHQKAEDREAIANPPMDTTGLSRISILLEELPRRAWPVIHGPFLVTLGLLVAVNLIAANSLLFGHLYAVGAGSMEPTIATGDKVFVAYHILTGDPRRGDVIAVRYPVDRRTIFFKRIVGVPGDRLKIVDKNMWLNGKAVNEPYVRHFTSSIEPYRDNFPSEPSGPVDEDAFAMLQHNVQAGELAVPPGKYFVLGDNRDNSLDSRYWGFAAETDIVGRPVILLGKGNRQFLRYPLGN
jgi:signal peptidase I